MPVDKDIEESALGKDYHLFIDAQKEGEELKERLFELYLLYTLSKNLNLSIQLNGLFEKVIKLLKDSLKIEDFCLMLMDEELNELKVWKANEITYDTIKDITFKMGEGVSGIAAQTGEPILIQDVSKDDRFLYYRGKLPNIGSFMSIPLKSANDKVIGVLNIHKYTINAFKETDKVFFSAVAENVAHTIERARVYEKAQKEAMFDGLTALYTRRYFLENTHRQCSKAERYREVFSIILLDIDYFKYFNDTYGHLMGDEILKKIAYLLKTNIRQSDIVSRYGGEEFIILLPKTDRDGASSIAEKLRNLVEKDLAMDSRGEKITITAGVANYPEDGKTVEEIIATADKLLYFGKESGRNKVVSHIPDMKESEIEEKRQSNRYNAALRAVRGINRLQSIEIRINDKEWKLCALRDVSQKGLKGELEGRVKIGDIYTCNAVLSSADHEPYLFRIKIVQAKEIHHNRYQIGAEIIDEDDKWERIFTLFTH